MPTIQENISEINNRILKVCENCGRDPKTVRLIGVSKTQNFQRIQEAVSAGLMRFGENKIQELLQKIPLVQGNPEWHFIGHLQTNKVKKVIGVVHTIHSVDSFHLAEEIERVSASKNTVTKILIQVNTSGEDSKFGCKPAETTRLIREILPLAHITIQGLMTIGPLSGNAEDARTGFRLLKVISQELKRTFPDAGMDELSMGMTGDFEAAIEEGATYLRIGTAIFGDRKL
jgi:hypothetical protein